MAQTHHLDVMRDLFGLLGFAQIGKHRVHGQSDIPIHGQPRHQRIALKDHAPFRAWFGNRRTLESDRSLGGFLKTGHQVDQSCLARAREPQKDKELALLHIKGDILENMGGMGASPKALAHGVECQNTHGFVLSRDCFAA